MTTPTPASPVHAPDADVKDHLRAPVVPVPDAVVRQLTDVCAAVDTSDEARQLAGRDWWPIGVRWAMAGEVAARPAVVARPADADQVAAVMEICHRARLPVTPMAGRSGVCGASVPVFGGVALDLCGLAGIDEVDDTSLVADVRAGTFGPDLEHALGERGLTAGHWPQSMALSTVGGWVACRGAGQYSTRYGKIEDIVAGLDVVLADGRRIVTGGAAPRAAVGPDLTQLIVGSEGTLGVVTSVRLRLHPAAPHSGQMAFTFPDFAAGLAACRLTLRRGATPAVLRLYDPEESARNFDVTGRCLLVVLDEADPALVQATLSVVAESARSSGGEPADAALVERWLRHRNDVSALAPLYQAGIVVDTIEVAARWAALPDLYRRCRQALAELDGTIVASAHQSHAYGDGACLYFTFAGRRPGHDGDRGTPRGSPPGPPGGSPARGPDTGPSTVPDTGQAAVPDTGQAAPRDTGWGADDRWAERYYVAAWEAVTAEVAAAGGAISHHHGVGLNRARFMAGAPGTDLGVLQAVKDALDPRGILNPGKLGLSSPFGEVLWPPPAGMPRTPPPPPAVEPHTPPPPSSRPDPSPPSGESGTPSPQAAR